MFECHPWLEGALTNDYSLLTSLLSQHYVIVIHNGQAASFVASRQAQSIKHAAQNWQLPSPSTSLQEM